MGAIRIPHCEPRLFASASFWIHSSILILWTLSNQKSVLQWDSSAKACIIAITGLHPRSAL